jgi:D-lactate dehydrogenase (cytochrome)
MLEKTRAFDERLVRRALDMGGTCTGEHGIGMGKLKHMRNEHGDGAVDTMKTIKSALDPLNIMNPGKVVDC